MPSGFFWGGLGQSLSQNIGRQLEQNEERKLKQEMLKLQGRRLKMEEDEYLFKTKNAEREILDMTRQDQAMERLIGSMMPQMPQIQTDVGDNPVGLTAAPEELSQQMRQGLMIQSTPRSQRGQLMQRMIGNKGGTGFSNPQDAISFRNSPEFKTLYPYGARTHQGEQGFTFSGMNPTDAAASRYHSVLNETGDRALAQQAYNETIFGRGASQGAGNVAGTTAQQLGEPVQPMQPMQGQATPPQVSRNAPSAAVSGPSQFMRAQENRARATKTGAQKAEAEEELITLADISGQIAELDNLSKQAFTSSSKAGYGERLLGGASQYARSFDPASPEGLYEARKQNVGEKLARGIGGVKGTATEGDIYRMLAALPRIPKFGVGLAETDTSRGYKIAAFNEIIQHAIKNKQDYIAGKPIDLTRAQQTFKQMVDQYVSGKYVPGQPPPNVGPQQGQGRLVPLQY